MILLFRLCLKLNTLNNKYKYIIHRVMRDKKIDEAINTIESLDKQVVYKSYLLDKAMKNIEELEKQIKANDNQPEKITLKQAIERICEDGVITECSTNGKGEVNFRFIGNNEFCSSIEEICSNVMFEKMKGNVKEKVDQFKGKPNNDFNKENLKDVVVDVLINALNDTNKVVNNEPKHDEIENRIRYLYSKRGFVLVFRDNKSFKRIDFIDTDIPKQAIDIFQDTIYNVFKNLKCNKNYIYIDAEEEIRDILNGNIPKRIKEVIIDKKESEPKKTYKIPLTSNANYFVNPLRGEVLDCFNEIFKDFKCDGFTPEIYESDANLVIEKILNEHNGQLFYVFVNMIANYDLQFISMDGRGYHVIPFNNLAMDRYEDSESPNFFHLFLMKVIPYYKGKRIKQKLNDPYLISEILKHKAEPKKEYTPTNNETTVNDFEQRFRDEVLKRLNIN